MIEVTIDDEGIDGYAEMLRWTLVDLMRDPVAQLPLPVWARLVCHLLYDHYDRDDVRLDFLVSVRNGSKASDDGRFTLTEVLKLHCKAPIKSRLPHVEKHVEKFLPKYLSCSTEDLARWGVIFILDLILYTSELKDTFDRQKLFTLFTSHDPTEAAIALDFCRFAIMTSLCTIGGHPLLEWEDRDWKECDDPIKTRQVWLENSIYQDDGKWYFWNETWSAKEGPFETMNAATNARSVYAGNS